MNTIQIPMPPALHERLALAARRQGLSVDQLLLLAAVERAALRTDPDPRKPAG